MGSLACSWPCWESIVRWRSVIDNCSLAYKISRVLTIWVFGSAWAILENEALYSVTWFWPKSPGSSHHETSLLLWELRSALQFESHIVHEFPLPSYTTAIWTVATWRYSHAAWHCNSAQRNLFTDKIPDQSLPTVTGDALQIGFCAFCSIKQIRHHQTIHVVSPSFIYNRRYPSVCPLQQSTSIVDWYWLKPWKSRQSVSLIAELVLISNCLSEIWRLEL